MEIQTEKHRPSHGQLISVPHKDTIRLLEVYVKRSLSLNDGTLGTKQAGKKEKWVTMARKHRRSSSDPSLFLAEGINLENADVFSAVEPLPDVPEKLPEDLEKIKVTKKNKKPSFFKTLFGFFTRKNDEDSEDDQHCPSEVSAASEPVTTCLPTTSATLQKRKKSLRRKRSKRLSKRASKLGKDLITADITGVGAVVSVEPTYAYYEKVSEELEKIVHEVKEKEENETLSDDEVLNRLIALTKAQGDVMEGKLKENPTLSNFFQRLTYSSFQKLADAYLEKETTTPTHNPPTVHPTAPELVKLAFTLDFTARIAGLSKQNIGHITCLGNRYLQDRFEYTQACTDHPYDSGDSSPAAQITPQM